MTVLVTKQSYPEALSIFVSAENVAEFQNLIHRATNIAPNLSPAMKAVADYVTNGKLLQDYDAQNHHKFPATQMSSNVHYIYNPIRR